MIQSLMGLKARLSDLVGIGVPGFSVGWQVAYSAPWCATEPVLLLSRAEDTCGDGAG